MVDASKKQPKRINLHIKDRHNFNQNRIEMKELTPSDFLLVIAAMLGFHILYTNYEAKEHCEPFTYTETDSTVTIKPNCNKTIILLNN